MVTLVHPMQDVKKFDTACFVCRAFDLRLNLFLISLITHEEKTKESTTLKLGALLL